MAVELKVPSVGESITEVFIGEWLKQEGERVEKDEPLVEIETDKATLEVPASVSGTLSKVLKKQGESAEVGEVIAHITEADAATGEDEAEAFSGASEAEGAPEEDVNAEEGAEAQPKEDKAAEDKKKPAQQEPVEEAAEDDAEAEPRIMPAAQRLLDEYGLSPGDLRGSGPGGRILKEDVERHLEKVQAVSEGTKEAPAPKERTAPAGRVEGEREEEVVPMSPLRRTIARRLVEAQQTAALLTTFNEIDMTNTMALRSEYKGMFEQRYGIRLGFMSFFVKAAIDALKQFPAINAEIRDDDIVYKNYYDIAIAVSSKKGLVTPVIRDAERLSFAEVESTIADFGERAQNNKLSPEELQGGTFTISNGGVFGSLMSTPIVNPPQSGVLGMHAIQQRPVAIDNQVEIRPMMYVALTYDHRIVDGREAVTFLKRIKEAIEAPARMLLEI